MLRTLGASGTGNKGIYIACAILIPFANSLLNPVLSLFAVSELNFSALEVSLFFILLPLVTISIVQGCARYSDRGLQRPLIITVASTCGALSCLLLISRPDFMQLCLLGLPLMGAYALSFPQLFASAREFSLLYLKSALMFTTWLRSLCSLAWVAGPPLAYMTATEFSFDTLFIGAGSVFLINALLAFILLPAPRLPEATRGQGKLSLMKSPQLTLLSIGCAAAFTAFSGYMISMPLYVVQELMLPDKLPGLMLGLAALLEIPIMLLAARFSRRLGLKRIVLAGCVCLCLFLCLMCYAHQAWLLVTAQILSALFIGMVSSMGMVLFQELAPQYPGQATSLYVNSVTCGQILGGGLFALADLGSCRLIYAAGIALSLLAILALSAIKSPSYRAKYNQAYMSKL